MPFTNFVKMKRRSKENSSKKEDSNDSDIEVIEHEKTSSKIAIPTGKANYVMKSNISYLTLCSTQSVSNGNAYGDL